MKKMYFILSLMILSINGFSQPQTYKLYDIGDFLKKRNFYSNDFLYQNKIEYDYSGVHCNMYKQKCALERHEREDINYKLYSRFNPEDIPFDIDTIVLGEKELIESVHIPQVLYDDYKYGYTLMKAGGITIGVGAACCLGGMISYVVASKRTNMDALKSGNILMGIGGSLISVSIPLLSCGAFHKWHANHDFNLHCL